MPESLAHFLQSINLSEADEVWQYLDGTPHVAVEMIDLLLESHPSLKDGGQSVEKSRARSGKRLRSQAKTALRDDA